MNQLLRNSLVLIALVLMSVNSFSQSKYDGTYQIEVLGRGKPYIPSNIDEIINSKRDKTKVVYYSLGTNARIKILPLNKVEAPEFKREENQVVNVQSFN